MKSRRIGKFYLWIVTQGGSGALSKKLDVTRHTINAWLRQESTPDTELAVRLVKMGRGKFTHDDIIKDTYDADVRAKKWGRA